MTYEIVPWHSDRVSSSTLLTADLSFYLVGKKS